MTSNTLEQAREIYATVRLLQDRMARRHAQLPRQQAHTPICNDLTLPQWNTLMVIREHAGMTIKEVAEAMQVSPPSASAMVDRLVEMGMAIREQSQKDRREVHVKPTAQGLAGIESMESHLMEALTDLLEKVGPVCAHQWCDVYARIREIILAEQRTEAVEGQEGRQEIYE
jgi:DNA-binding MarR family transcriptional regulator